MKRNIKPSLKSFFNLEFEDKFIDFVLSLRHRWTGNQGKYKVTLVINIAPKVLNILLNLLHISFKYEVWLSSRKIGIYIQDSVFNKDYNNVPNNSNFVVDMSVAFNFLKMNQTKVFVIFWSAKLTDTEAQIYINPDWGWFLSSYTGF